MFVLEFYLVCMFDVEIITVSERGQIVLPKKIRESKNIHKGTKLLLIEKDNKLILNKIDEVVKETPEGVKTFIASEETLKKDWSYVGDERWNNL